MRSIASIIPRRKLIYSLVVFIFLSSLLGGCALTELAPAESEINAEAQAQEIEKQAVAESDNENIIFMIQAAIGLLFVASLVGVISKRLRVPYTLGLVLIGLALSLFGEQEFNLSPNLFLGLLVPPLIFEAAFHLKIKDLKQDIAPILGLAVPGVLITTLIVGGFLAWRTDITLTSALVFGALIAAIDPVAVISLFRSLGVPKRLQVLMEGESLFNDGTAIVLFNMMIAIAVTGEFNLVDSILDFFIVSGGGLLVGFILGLLISEAISLINDPMIETTMTTVLAFSSYLIAEQFHVSGVLAVVAAGIISGNLGPRRMSPTTRVLVFSFWEYAAFLANSFIFLLIGLQINLSLLLANWDSILWAIAALLITRAISVYGLSWFGKGVPRRYKVVLYWGGLKGAISFALALSLPAALGSDRAEIQALTFGTVLFTLLVQGLTMKPLINKMNLIERSAAQIEYEERQARSVMARASYDQLKDMYHEGYLNKHIWDVLSEPLKKRTDSLSTAVTRAMHQHPEVEADELESAVKEILETQRSSLHDMLHEGRISEKIYSELVSEVDSAFTDSQTDLVDMLRHKISKEITTLMTVIIPEAEVEKISLPLGEKGYPVTHVASRGGFAGRKNATLLIGIPEGEDQRVLELIKEAGGERTRDLSVSSQEDYVITGGATIFSFDIERYEVI